MDVPIYDFDPFNLPPKLLQAIGLVVQAAAQTENLLTWGIGGCLGLDPEYTIAVTAHMSVPLKVSVLLAAAEIKIDDLDALDELDDIVDAAEKAIGSRNDAAHDNFCVHPETGQAHRVKQRARRRVEAELKPVVIDDIIKDARVIHDAGLELMSFLMKHSLVPPALSGFRPRGHKTKAARKARRTKMGK